MIKGVEQVYISNINSPNQVVLSGKTEAVKNFGNRLKEMGYRATLLRVSMAFHSPIMRVIRDELEAFIAPIPFHAPQIPSSPTRPWRRFRPIPVRSSES